MAVPTQMSELSVTADNNSPLGSESPISTDNFHRAIQAILRHTNAKGADIASATTTDIGAATGEFVDITGTTTITGLGTIAAGIERTVRFTGILTLTHNATSLILPGGANITTASGDTAIFRSLGSGSWICIGYKRADGKAINTTIADDTVTAASLADSALGFSIINGTITASVSSNALTIAIKNKAGSDPSSSDPVLAVFRNSTLNNGSYVVRAVTVATSVVVSSGSTLGTANGVASELDVIAIDNAGTVELAVINNVGNSVLDQSGVISTTAEGGAGGADTIGTAYSTTARSNVAYRLIGKITSAQATAGTWATSPSNVSIIPNFYPSAKSIKPALNATGEAPIYAARAWVNFNGTGTLAIRGSGNVSSVTDNGTGDYTINFATAMPDANYAMVGMSRDKTGGLSSPEVHPTTAPTSSALRIYNRNSGVGVEDNDYISITVFA